MEIYYDLERIVLFEYKLIQSQNRWVQSWKLIGLKGYISFRLLSSDSRRPMIILNTISLFLLGTLIWNLCMCIDLKKSRNIKKKKIEV